jgi:putative nicotinate phosphoribosyltransferase
MLYQIPVRGTHAHSWVMAFESELAAFSAYAEVMPNNCVFLVDTYETIAGVGHAVTVGQRLKARGHTMIGVRLDSGDLEALSFEARRLLDEGGLEEAVVVASNDLDERSIAALTAKGAPIGVYGVGTKLVTAYDQPALGGVYKLAAIAGRGRLGRIGSNDPRRRSRSRTRGSSRSIEGSTRTGGSSRRILFMTRRWGAPRGSLTGRRCWCRSFAAGRGCTSRRR